mgnify:CR=1 FL=1
MADPMAVSAKVQNFGRCSAIPIPIVQSMFPGGEAECWVSMRFSFVVAQRMS